jgi:hypothetical protein
MTVIAMYDFEQAWTYLLVPQPSRAIGGELCDSRLDLSNYELNWDIR